MSKQNVLVTGFGPFGAQTVNASWVAVQELTKLWNDQSNASSWQQSHELQTREIPVSYSSVNNDLIGMYQATSPVLCVHVGVSPYNVVVLEKVGRNNGYTIPDVDGKTPLNGIVKDGGQEAIAVSVHLEPVVQTLSSGGTGVVFEISDDAGRYLCDFIFYSSLYLNRCPVVFVHVPPLHNPYTAEQLGQALKDIIEVLLTDIRGN